MKKADAGGRLKATAYHEAGHAVVAWKLGIAFKKVTIVREGDAAGHVKYRAKAVPFRIRAALEFGTLTDRQQAWAQWWAERHAVHCLAGMVAQRKFSPRSVRNYHDEGDRESALTGLERLVPEEDLLLYWRIMRNRARRLIDRYWEAVEALAQELLKRMTLTGDEAVKIIQLSFEERIRMRMGGKR
jgi:hypothetical protein